MLLLKKEVTKGDNPNSKNIKISVEEMPTGEISAGAGIGTNGGSFAFAVKENNYLGKGIRISANAEVSAESVRGSLAFTDTNYNFTGKELTYSLENIKNDKPDSGYENSVLGAGIGSLMKNLKIFILLPA